MGNYVYISGQYLPKEQAFVSAFDHGFLYGDGLFEGIRTYNGRVFKLEEHLRRLYNSAHALMIDIGMTQQEMLEAVLELSRRNEVKDCYNRITVSRGVSLGLDPRNCNAGATVCISNDALSLYPEKMYQEGLTVMTVSTRVPLPQSVEPRIKSTGKYVSNIQAKLEANMVGAGEGLLLNVQGYVAECTGDNIFLVRNGVLITPPPSVGILEGITRNSIIELAHKLGIPFEEKLFTLFDVYNADECFLTGTAAEAIPVQSVDGRVIASGKPGPVTEQLRKAFRELTQSTGVPIYGDRCTAVSSGR